MTKPLVVISGLPGSGKSTLGGQLARTLSLRLLDKDDILERLFESKGLGNAEWRKALSRESDEMLKTEAALPGGAVLFPTGTCPACLPIPELLPAGFLNSPTA